MFLGFSPAFGKANEIIPNRRGLPQAKLRRRRIRNAVSPHRFAILCFLLG
jgi:hypothetical protein